LIFVAEHIPLIPIGVVDFVKLCINRMTKLCHVAVGIAATTQEIQVHRIGLIKTKKNMQAFSGNRKGSFI